MRTAVKRLLKEPVLQFLILGGGLFVVYTLFAPAEAPPRDEIRIGAPRIESLASNFERTWRRRPTRDELDGLIEDYIAEEVFYREALKLGLDRDDLVVRRRMRQKMELLLSDALSAAPPDEAELRAYFDAQKVRYRRADRLTFRQVFLGQKPANASATWASLAQQLNGHPDMDFTSVGVPGMLPPGMERTTATEIAGVFGEAFAKALAELAPGHWSGPVESAYGWHLVRTDAAFPSAEPVFGDVRVEVARDVAYEREREARAELVERLKANYAISIEGTTK